MQIAEVYSHKEIINQPKKRCFYEYIYTFKWSYISVASIDFIFYLFTPAEKKSTFHEIYWQSNNPLLKAKDYKNWNTTETQKNKRTFGTRFSSTKRKQ